MSNKLTYEFVKSVFEKERYSLVSREYMDCKTKLSTVCPQGHTYMVNINAFKDDGDRCSECAGVKKYDFEYVKKIIESEGYVLISTKYKSGKTKLKTICPKGHPYDLVFSRFLNNGDRCSTCSGLYKYNIDNVTEIFKNEGYLLLSTKYKNGAEKLKTICPNKHSYIVALNGFLAGNRCSECRGLKPHSLKEIQDFFDQRGEKLLSKGYINNKQKLEVLCKSRKHTYSIKFNTATSMNTGCPYCSGNYKKTMEEVRAIFFKEGYVVLSTEYGGSKKKIKTRCPSDHIYEVRLSDFIGKHQSRCTSCWVEKQSKLEIEILNWIKQRFPHAAKHRFPYVHTNGRKRTFEVDIFIEELKLAIEFNGLYWHSDVFKEKDNSTVKLNRCSGAGVRLITIFEDEWVFDQENTKNKILAIFDNREKEEILSRIRKAKTEGLLEMEIVTDNRWDFSKIYEDLGFIFTQDIEIKEFYIRNQKRVTEQESLNSIKVFDCGYKKWKLVIGQS